ncbi:hypothetical protein F511_06011 [Dorcoceras hygrometricum]|uniref:Late embryogenesis abundant protein LEA-2 subgroup domain-containing protein n=1 Tax=Dorcoceras hygrometricum TaxID=472368 RepID=A0A2Z7AW65_9LAMI|nr:hypothetical protein F511_06011 [Dorcoceras hygrometricum]
MQHAKSESDVTSLAPSSPPRSPKRHAYYVQSPSRDSHDGDKSSYMHPSPMESPSHHSFGRHSRNSSASRFSGILPSSGRKGQKRNDKGWPECDVIMEEGKYDEFDDDKKFKRRCQAAMAVGGFILLFTIFCLIIWGAGRPFKAEVAVKVNKFTSFFSSFVSFQHTHIHIYIYIYVCVCVEKKQKRRKMIYFQPRKSRRTVKVHIEGTKVPLYGAGLNLQVASNNAVQVPLTLNFTIKSRGDVVGKLVRTNHRKIISCPLKIDSNSTKIIEFKNSCNYS